MTSSTSFNLSQLELPTTYDYRGHDLADISRQLLLPMVTVWQNLGLVSPDASFGLVGANLDFAGHYDRIWDEPAQLIGFAVMCGPEGRKHCFNALRKMRPTARVGFTTLHMAWSDMAWFRDVVEPETGDPDNPYAWGDLPQGGAHPTGANWDPHQLVIGVDGLTCKLDDALACSVGASLHALLDELDPSDET